MPNGIVSAAAMRRQGICLPAVSLAVLLLGLSGCGASAGNPQPSVLVPIGAGVRGPAGLRATVYAKGPPTLAAVAFDPQGRLWLAAAGLEAHTHDGVYVITKSGGPAVKVISGLDDPLGLLWHAGELYVSSVGRVDAFGGFNGSRFTTRTEVLRGPVARGENNALVLGPDGRLVMGITASCDHCLPKSMWSGAIVSFRPDGSGLRLYAGRIRAPVGLAYVPGTGDLLATMNQRDDLGAATPGDWLGLVRQGQSWGFPGCYGQGGADCKGLPQPIAVLDKHAAVGDLEILTGQLGLSGTSAIVPEWQSAKVQRVLLSRAGAGYTGSVTPFLTGIRNPLALTLTPDSSLLIGDWATGTIYRVAAR
jgi:glucose/arabinose dehydrogenase